MSRKREARVPGPEHPEARAGQTGGEGEAQEPRSPMGVVWDQIGTFGLAIVIALTIRAFLIEPFRIPSGSMFPTLLIGDHLFVNKFLYGPRIPFTEWRLPGIREPRRGDVVVFEVAMKPTGRGAQYSPADRHPELARTDFVKRLVGLPGDRISVRDGRITINGETAEWASTGERFVADGGLVFDEYRENLFGCEHAVLDDPDHTGLGRTDFVVPEGRYFMMGDNRDHSNDSRGWGTVRLAEFKGPAFILYWSWEVDGNSSALQFFNPVNWFVADKRWDRVFSSIRCEDPADD